MPGTDPVPEGARRELDRIRARWTALPAARAEEAAPLLAALVSDLGAASAAALGHPPVGPGLLPPAVLPDALAVVVHDACTAGLGANVEARLTEVRRALP